MALKYLTSLTFLYGYWAKVLTRMLGGGAKMHI